MTKPRLDIARWFVCQECGIQFQRHGRGPEPTYCSYKCRQAKYIRRIAQEKREATARRREERTKERTRYCPICGKAFVSKPYQPQIYCSRSCRQKANPSGSQFQKTLPDEERTIRDRARCARRRAIERTRRIDRRAIFERDEWVCKLCGQPVDPNLKYPNRESASLDHIKPLALGGKHEEQNVQLAHFKCNSRKSARRDYLYFQTTDDWLGAEP